MQLLLCWGKNYDNHYPAVPCSGSAALWQELWTCPASTPSPAQRGSVGTGTVWQAVLLLLGAGPLHVSIARVSRFTCNSPMSMRFLTRTTCKKVWHKSYISGHCLPSIGSMPCSGSLGEGIPGGWHAYQSVGADSLQSTYLNAALYCFRTLHQALQHRLCTLVYSQALPSQLLCHKQSHWKSSQHFKWFIIPETFLAWIDSFLLWDRKGHICNASFEVCPELMAL